MTLIKSLHQSRLPLHCPELLLCFSLLLPCAVSWVGSSCLSPCLVSPCLFPEPSWAADRFGHGSSHPERGWFTTSSTNSRAWEWTTVSGEGINVSFPLIDTAITWLTAAWIASLLFPSPISGSCRLPLFTRQMLYGVQTSHWISLHPLRPTLSFLSPGSQTILTDGRGNSHWYLALC